MEQKFLKNTQNEIHDLLNQEGNRKLEIQDYYENNHDFFIKLTDNNIAIRKCELDDFRVLKKNDQDHDKCEFQIECRRCGDLVDKAYLILELCDNYNVENTSGLLDILSSYQVSMEIGGSRIFQTTIGLLYFIATYLGEEIYYVELDKIKHELDQFDQNVQNKMTIKQLIRQQTTGQKQGNKYLLIPMSFNFLVKNLNLIGLAFHGITFRLQGTNHQHVCSMVKTFKISLVYLFLGNKLRQTVAQKSFELKALSSTIDKYLFHTHESIRFKFPCYLRQYMLKYFTVSISPQYDKIDRDLWSTVPSLLPEIQCVQSKHSNQQYLIENAEIRRGNSHVIYLFSGDPNYTMKNWITKHMTENDGVLEQAMGNATSTNNKQVEESLSRKRKRCVNYSANNQEYTDIHIVLTPCSIPINVETCYFQQNKLRIMSGMGGLAYSS